MCINIKNTVNLSVNYDLITWLGLIGLGTLGTVVPLALIYFGAKDVSPNVASILLLTELIWVFLFGILIFGETLTISTVLGTIGVISSILLVL